jgi:hypothetical protein
MNGDRLSTQEHEKMSIREQLTFVGESAAQRLLHPFRN